MQWLSNRKTRGARKSIDLPLVGLDYNSYWKMGEWAIMPFYKLIVTSSRANFGRQESVPLFFASHCCRVRNRAHRKNEAEIDDPHLGLKVANWFHRGIEEEGYKKNYQQRNWSWLRCARLHLWGGNLLKIVPYCQMGPRKMQSISIIIADRRSAVIVG